MKSASQIAEALKDFQASGAAPARATSTGKKTAGLEEPDRLPYSFNVGLDFGTAFTKCILRDIRQDRAAPVAFSVTGVSTFLAPSEVYLDGAVLRTPLDGAAAGSAGVGCLKMALYATARGFRGDPWLLGVSRHWPADDEATLHRKIEALVIFYLAAIIRHCRVALLAQRPDFGEHTGDAFSVNMAVPVAHTEHGEGVFAQCLNRAWRLAHDGAAGPMALNDLLDAIGKLRRAADEHLCAIYPEVSANVQAFIRSRSGLEGLFMFVDVGAGTVDASTFIYWPQAVDGKTLSYLSAEVVALGSSQIELRAVAELAARFEQEFRRCKEGVPHETSVSVVTGEEVKKACAILTAELLAELTRCAAQAREKLVRQSRRHAHTKQWRDLRILLGGGGSALPMYGQVAEKSFTTWTMQPPAMALPLPVDLEWPDGIMDRAAVFRRMTVAYGLSFEFLALDQHRFPDEIEPLPEDNAPPSPRYHAPSKDEV